MGTDLDRLIALIQAYRSTQVTYVMAKLDLADHLADAPLSAGELSARVSVDARSLRRVLRLAALYGLVAEVADGRFELTELGRPLRGGVKGSVKSLATMLGEQHYHAWGALLHTVRTGEPAFEHVYGAPFFEYMATNPQMQATFDAAMSAGVDVFFESMAERFDFTRFHTIVDVGGGNGSFSAMLLKHTPSIQAVIYDQPQVLDAARKYLSAQGVLSRCRLVAGDFFESVPEGGDLYFLSNIIHDWDDERALSILENCRNAMSPDASLVLLELVMPEHGSPSRAAMADVNMMVLLTGCERTEAEYAALLAAAKMRLTRVVPVSERESLIEAGPA